MNQTLHIALVALAGALCPIIARAANVTSSWATATTGNWESSTCWTNNPVQIAFPNNGVDTFDATIGVSTGNYSVSIFNVPITVNNFTLSSSTATVGQANAFTVANTFTQSAGVYTLSANTLTAGGLNLTGGAFNLTGGTLAPTSITLNGGKIVGGTITTNGTGHLTVMNNGNNTLDGVTLSGGLVLDQTNGRASLVNDANFNGFSATLSATNTLLIFDTTATDTTATVSNATINMDGSSSRIGIERASPVVTLASNSTLRGRGSVTFGTIPFTASNTQLVNQGIISGDLAGQTLTLATHLVSNSGTMRAINGGNLTLDAATSFTNSTGATLSATGGSTLMLRRTWHNQGALILQDTSVLSLEGTFTTSDLGLAGWSRSGGTVNLVGALNNTGATLDFDTTGVINLNGGNITGGTIHNGASGRLVITNNGSNYLDGVTITGGMTLDQTNCRVRLLNDATFSGSNVTASADSTVLSFEATATDTTATLSNSTINMDGNGGRIGLDRADMALTLASTTTVRGRGNITAGTGFFATSNTVLNNQGIISADLPGQTFTISPHSATNTGTMRAINGATLDLFPSTSLTNAPGGIISATGGSTILFRQFYHNQGTIVLQDTSSLWFYGNFTTTDLGASGWSRSGGTVNIAGVLDNTGATLDVTATGELLMNGGRLFGGTVINSAASRLVFTNNSANRLDGTALIGGLYLPQSTMLALQNDASISGDVVMDYNSKLGFIGTATDNSFVLSGTVVNMNDSNTISIDGINPQLTIAASSTVRGRGQITQFTFGGITGSNLLTNQGLVSADLAGQVLTLSVQNMVNTGTMRAINGATLLINPITSFTNQAGGILSATGGSTLTLQKNWHNQGTLVLQDTSLLNLQGTFTTADLGIGGWLRTGGTVNLSGALNNTGATLTLNATTGNFTLAGGSITGGALDNTSATNGRLVIANNSANVLDGVTVTGGLIFDIFSSQIKVRNDTSLEGNVNFTGASNNLFLDGTATDNTITLTSRLTMNLDGTNANVGFTGTNPIVTLGPSVLVRGRGTLGNGAITGSSQLINQGRIVADLSGQTLTIAPNALVNTGSFEAQNGATLSIPTGLLNQSAGMILLLGGYLQVNGNQAGPDITLGANALLEGYGEVRFANATTDSLSLSGTISPDLGTGGLAIKGDLILTSSAVLAFDITGTTQGTGYDFLSEAGSTALDLAGSTLRVTVANGYTPPNAQTLTIIGSTQTITGNFGNVASGSRITSIDGLWTFLVTRSGTTVTLSDAKASPASAYLSYVRGAYRGSMDPALTGHAADPDQDGVPNLLEFALKGDPASPGNLGLMTELMQDVDPSPGQEFTLIIAVRQGAVFSQQPDGSQKNLTAIDSLHYAVQGSSTLSTFPLPVLHVGPSFTAPASTGLPDLTGSGWEYHTFYLAPASISTHGFLRVVVDGGP